MNAVNFTEKGHVKIDCIPVGDSMRITVSDTGIGIPEDKIDSVFDEYYQLDNQVRDRCNGLGLGLSIVKQIAVILECPLNVSSVLGKGTIFTIEVPLGEKIATIKQEVLNITDLGHHELTVLFVEDDPAIVDATTMLLNTLGVQLKSVLSGDDALALIETGIRPDIIISDFGLPQFNGIEVIRRVRAATFDSLPAIIMTGDTYTKEIANANLDNCTVLYKPVDTDKLISVICDCLQ